ncbi:MAG: DUF3025 domain-containing protein [Janthinobacterium lividum]
MQLKNHRSLPLCFVDQSDLPANLAYETFISCYGKVPTRLNLHDFFNALVWLTFPGIKARLNALQSAAIEKTGSAVRGKLRDAATLFDENAALVVVDDLSWLALLREHAWQTLFVDQRAQFQQSSNTWLFGHALMEKLVHPYKSITAHAWVIVIPADHAYWRSDHDGKLACLDLMVETQLDESLTSLDFTPLPVLGLSGWWPDQDAGFYGDLDVFRPRRRNRCREKNADRCPDADKQR